ncbi:hypothetical protein JCM33374_g1974 [Metschnikowia sp. JCM 33374]|nr:hypothetical protein JCM33374_g1974 [Metschnikowia sp. JCM 33374]
MASDQEVPKFSKAQLRVSVAECVTRLQHEVLTSPSIDKANLTFFYRTLRKMIHINEMSSCDLRRSNTKSVLKEMISDVQSLTNRVDEVSGVSECEEFFIRGAIKAMNAFSVNIGDSCSTPSHSSNVTDIRNIGKSFQNVLLLATHKMFRIPLWIQGGVIQKDVAAQVFHVSAKIFHEVTLSFPEISQLPIKTITFLHFSFTNEMQNVSLAAFSKRDPDLSQETFKTWWIFSSMFQEYMGVMSRGSDYVEPEVGLIFRECEPQD